mmetsp:Transcript_2737/g.4811  ORF Transcript_2737/g.4811 Transcript_2737/m.4811 type:complete len:85 (+) Transcript_2737:479-733(+)
MDVHGLEIELGVVDVTRACQYMVEESQIQTYATSKSTLPGFWDASVEDEDPNVLRIWYSFRNAPHECTIQDHEAIELPLSSHKI